MRFLCRLILLLFLLTAQSEVWAATVTNIRTSTAAMRRRIVLDLDGPAAYKETATDKLISLKLAASAKARQLPVRDSSISSVALVPEGRDSSRLDIALNKTAQHRVLVLKKPDRIVIDVYRIAVVKNTRSLGKGLDYTYWQDDFGGEPLRLYILEMHPGSNYYLRPFSAAVNQNGRGRLSRASQALGAVAAVNACYFDTDGWVIGNCEWQGSFFGIEETPRSALVIDANGTPQVMKDVAYRGVVTLPSGKDLTILGLNRARISDDLVLYNNNYGTSTGTNSFGREVRIAGDRIQEVSDRGNMKLSAGSLVLSGHGINSAAMAVLKPGSRINLQQTLGSVKADTAQAVIGGGPSLLTDGQVDVRSSQEQLAPDIAWGRAPRTAVGIKSDGTVIVLVADGRSDYSTGLTLTELARYLKRLGAVQAVNFDGGGSSEMVVNQKVMNDPSDGDERPVSIGLGIFAK
jgi:hypothetical protein